MISNRLTYEELPYRNPCCCTYSKPRFLEQRGTRQSGANGSNATGAAGAAGTDGDNGKNGADGVSPGDPNGTDGEPGTSGTSGGTGEGATGDDGQPGLSTTSLQREEITPAVTAELELVEQAATAAKAVMVATVETAQPSAQPEQQA